MGGYVDRWDVRTAGIHDIGWLLKDEGWEPFGVTSYVDPTAPSWPVLVYHLRRKTGARVRTGDQL